MNAETSLAGTTVLSESPPSDRSEQKEVLNKQQKLEDVQVGFFQLYRDTTRGDIGILAICTLLAIAGGAILPIMTVVFGSLAGKLNSFTQHLHLEDTYVGETIEQIRLILKFRRDLSRLTLDFVYLGIGEFFAIFLCTFGFAFVGDRTAQRARQRYLKAALSQNMAFFNNIGTGDLTTRITNDTNLIQEAISQKVSNTITALATFVTAFIIVLDVAWRLGLVSLSSVVAMTLVMASMSRLMLKYSKKSLYSFSLGSTIAEEAISAIRVTVACGAQTQLAERYRKHMRDSKRAGTLSKTFLGVSIAGMSCIIMLNYGLNFWAGSIFLVHGEIQVDKIVTVIYATIIGAFSLGFLAPNVQAFSSGIAAATKLYAITDRKSPIDPFSTDGRQPDVHPDAWSVDFQDVKLVYPSRPNVTVLDNFTLHIPAGKTTALVGPSGSGKSSIINLLERFYPHLDGQILVAGHDIQQLNVGWLRENISLVDQEPVLFDTTVENNILYGLAGSRLETLSREEKYSLMMMAAEKANALEFVQRLPGGFQARVGERGSLLSGGQRQRIAIARAIIRDPGILILDEATSALDTSSESLVQDALNRASQGRTTIVIAHRLSTIRKADNIVVLANGKIVEQGTHANLLKKRSSYFSLVEAQQIRIEPDEKMEFADPPTYGDHEKEEAAHPAHKTPSKTRVITSLDQPMPYPMPSHAHTDNQTTRQKKPKGVLSFVLSFNKQDTAWMVLGLIMSIFGGSGTPTSAVFFAKCIQSMSKPPRLYHELRHDVNFWAGMYLWLGVFLFIVNVIRDRAFAKCSERMLFRARDLCFRTILRQEMAFFEPPSIIGTNAASGTTTTTTTTTGSLISFLATETTNMSGLSGPVLGTILSMSTCIIAAIVVSIVFSWKLGLVCTSTVPVLLGSGFLRFYMLSYAEEKSKSAYAQSASYACEALSSMRTVASLGREEHILTNYTDQLSAQSRAALRDQLISAALYGASQALPFFCIGLGFWWGGTLMSRREISLFQFFVCFSEIVFSAQTAGYMFASTPDVARARTAAASLKAICDRKPTIDPWSDAGIPLQHPGAVTGQVEFQNVFFTYSAGSSNSSPAAYGREQYVLKGVNIKALPGQYVALVGASGSGKSTCIALLERFYDCSGGRVLIDGRDIQDLNINHYRSHVGLVSQEPVLYHGTIKENILLGTSGDISEQTLYQACREANIYDFIISLPEGFDTMVGSKGVLLSGGQKQRISIARALIRNPSILLLDEATSALDSESEKIVQAALNKASQGRTTIAIAHRLSSIQDADHIYVLEQGQVVEQGTHSSLMDAAGRYAELVRMQRLGAS
ncbi:hypothetical protein PV08_09492 [Exophiala spinifera]|uniref:ABC transporter n=1 Tax=Exophiala spinifera TaxID=91928 RepID=A0A0D1YBA9_9EURO|nr:uncharacterized protein PV08_09492 [Exophiala spinifera]KIW12216.1 hypothetical protein PV08_09492 [Exophiala spinifera]